MKVRLVFPILLSLFFLSCKEEKKIEIVPNLEAEYFAENEVDKQVEYISDKDDSGDKSKTDLIEVIKSIHDSKAKDTLRYIIKLRLYINESGRIEKVKDISTIYDKAEYSADGIRNYSLRNKMNEALALKLAELQFHPAIKEGKKVKSWTDIKNVNVLATPDGKFEIELPDFLSGIFGSPDEYFVAVEQMPEIIGGMYSIQKNIRYPELAKRAGIEGKVYVLAFIDEHGDVVNAQIIKGIGGGCDEAALTAVKFVKFIPGRSNGKPVKTQVSIPIVFKLQ